MLKSWRMALLVGLGLLTASPAVAGIAEAVSLDQLMLESRQVVVGQVLDSHSVRESFGGRPRIVTYSRVRVEERLAGSPGDSEVMIRTLGGRVGDVAEIVHGAARLDRSQKSVLFLRERAPLVFSITAETQGVFPLRRDPKGLMVLSPMRGLSKLLGKFDTSASVRLRGLTLRDASQLIGDTYRRLRSAPKP